MTQSIQSRRIQESSCLARTANAIMQYVPLKMRKALLMAFTHRLRTCDEKDSFATSRIAFSPRSVSIIFFVINERGIVYRFDVSIEIQSLTMYLFIKYIIAKPFIFFCFLRFSESINVRFHVMFMVWLFCENHVQFLCSSFSPSSTAIDTGIFKTKLIDFIWKILFLLLYPVISLIRKMFNYI